MPTSGDPTRSRRPSRTTPSTMSSRPRGERPISSDSTFGQGRQGGTDQHDQKEDPQGRDKQNVDHPPLRSPGRCRRSRWSTGTPSRSRCSPVARALVLSVGVAVAVEVDHQHHQCQAVRAYPIRRTIARPGLVCNCGTCNAPTKANPGRWVSMSERLECLCHLSATIATPGSVCVRRWGSPEHPVQASDRHRRCLLG
jgi:hypothetical protein